MSCTESSRSLLLIMHTSWGDGVPRHVIQLLPTLISQPVHTPLAVVNSNTLPQINRQQRFEHNHSPSFNRDTVRLRAMLRKPPPCTSLLCRASKPSDRAASTLLLMSSVKTILSPAAPSTPLASLCSSRNTERSARVSFSSTTYRPPKPMMGVCGLPTHNLPI